MTMHIPAMQNETSALITGVSGFVGRGLAEALGAMGVRVFGVVRQKPLGIAIEAEFIGDIADRDFIRGVVERVQPAWVFHLAANKSRSTEFTDFRKCLDDNLIGTLNLVEACLAIPGLKRFVTLGTCEEYGATAPPFKEGMREGPVSTYSLSKVATTHLLQTVHRTHGFPAVILRPSLAYGPGQGGDMFLPGLIQTLLAGKRFPMSPGGQSRDYVYIDDLIEAILLAAVSPNSIGAVINVSSGVPTTILEVARMAAERVGANALHLLGVGERGYRPGEVMHYWADWKRAKELLGWCPRTLLQNGLTRTVEHYRAAMKCE